MASQASSAPMIDRRVEDKVTKMKPLIRLSHIWVSLKADKLAKFINKFKLHNSDVYVYIEQNTNDKKKRNIK